SLVPLMAVLVAAAPQPPVFHAGIQLVALNVTVIDDAGTVIRGLPPQAFVVTEDGKPRPIEQFASGTVPLPLAIALDASNSMVGRRFEYARKAVTRFLDRLGREDEVVVYGFNDSPFILKQWSDGKGAGDMPLNCVVPAGYTALYDMVATALNALQRSRHRRQALVLVTDGQDERSSDYTLYDHDASP